MSLVTGHRLRHRSTDRTQEGAIAMIRLTVRYARYALSMLSNVGFGTSFN
jgi:hypothetical protein